MNTHYEGQDLIVLLFWGEGGVKIPQSPLPRAEANHHSFARESLQRHLALTGARWLLPAAGYLHRERSLSRSFPPSLR